MAFDTAGTATQTLSLTNQIPSDVNRRLRKAELMYRSATKEAMNFYRSLGVVLPEVAGEGIRFEITDRGIFQAEENLKKLFEDLRDSFRSSVNQIKQRPEKREEDELESQLRAFHVELSKLKLLREHANCLVGNTFRRKYNGKTKKLTWRKKIDQFLLNEAAYLWAEANKRKGKGVLRLEAERMLAAQISLMLQPDGTPYNGPEYTVEQLKDLKKRFFSEVTGMWKYTLSGREGMSDRDFAVHQQFQTLLDNKISELSPAAPKDQSVAAAIINAGSQAGKALKSALQRPQKPNRVAASTAPYPKGLAAA